MADSEPVVATPPAAEAEEGAAAAGAPGGKGRGGRKTDRDTPRVPITEKPETVAEPSEADKNKAVAACNARIAGFEKRITDIKATLDRMSEDRKSRDGSHDTRRTELKALREKFNELKGKRQVLFETLGKAKEARMAAQDKLKEMQKTLRGASSVAEIDAKIADLERQIETSTQSLKEEKALMLEIKNLKASREQVKHVAAASAAVTALSTDIEQQKAMREEVKALDQEMTSIRDREKAIQAELDAAREKAQEKAGTHNPGELIKERKALQGKIKEERDAIRKIENEYERNAFLHRKYLREMREFKRYQDQQKYDEMRKEREEYRKKREQEEAEEEKGFKKEPTHPWAAELFACDDLVKYLKPLLPKKEKTSEKKSFDPRTTADKGLVPAGKKTIKDEDIFFAAAPKAKKGGKGGAAAAGGAGGAAGGAEAAEADRRLTHSFDILQAFLEIDVGVPQFTSQVPDAVANVKAAKARIQRLTAEDKAKKNAANAAAVAKTKQEAQKVAKARSAGSDAAPTSGVPAAVAVPEASIDFRKAVRGGVKGAHV